MLLLKTLTLNNLGQIYTKSTTESCIYISSWQMQVQIVLQNSVNTERHQSLKLKPFENLTVNSRVIIISSVTEPDLSGL